MKRFMVTIAPVVAFSCLAGCASSGLCAGIQFAADKYQSRDASTLCVSRHSNYRFDVRLRSDLEDAIGLSDFEELTREGGRVLAAAQALAVDAAGGEIDRMPPEGIVFLAERYCRDCPSDGQEQQRKMLKEKFSLESEAGLRADLQKLQAAADVRVARRLLRNIERRIEEPVGDRGRVGRALVAAPLFLPAAIGAEIADAKETQQVIDAGFEDVFVYRPPQSDDARTAEQLANADDEQLAQWFAPLIIQQHDPDAPYPQTEDQFGAVYLTGTRDDINVRIDIERPTVYWTMQEAKIEAGEDRQPWLARPASGSFAMNVGLRKRKQIVYVVWYPSRPALTAGDSEAGLIDGVVIRVTLDRHNRAAVYEFVRSCGCYHMLYIAEFVETAARHQFGAPLPNKKYALQRDSPRREMFIPSLVRDDGSHPAKPVAFVSAGHHLLMGVEAGGVWEGGAKVISKRKYRLEKYEVLTRLPLQDALASMFGSDGLVHNAGRPEGWLLAPTGMRSAGQPRQLGTMKIRMDAYDYDDPYLLDRQLRFPPDF